jgi:hypothetical protein
MNFFNVAKSIITGKKKLDMVRDMDDLERKIVKARSGLAKIEGDLDLDEEEKDAIKNIVDNYQKVADAIFLNSKNSSTPPTVSKWKKDDKSAQDSGKKTGGQYGQAP